MTALQNLILFCSKKWWAFVLITLVFGISLVLLMRLGDTFASLTNGHPPFDTQNNLTVQDIARQLSEYTPASYSAYWMFTANDFLFPFAGGLFTASILTFALRRLLPAAHEWMSARQLLPLFLLPTFFDWLENISIITMLTGQANAASTILFFKGLKLTTLTLSQTLMVLALFGVGLQWVTQRFRKNS